jgi:hypothetical protein
VSRIDKDSSHGLASENGGPFLEAQVAGDNHRHAFIKITDELKQQHCPLLINSSEKDLRHLIGLLFAVGEGASNARFIFDDLMAVSFVLGNPVDAIFLQIKGSPYPFTFVFIQHGPLSRLAHQCLLVLCLKKGAYEERYLSRRGEGSFLHAKILS